MANQRCQAVNAMLYPLFIWVPIVPFVRSTELEVGILIFYTAALAVCHVHYGIFLVSIRLHPRGVLKVHMTGGGGGGGPTYFFGVEN